MKLTDIDIKILKKVVDKLDDFFYTYDVSQDEDMINAHRFVCNESAYNALVGKSLKRNNVYLKISQTNDRSKRGSGWIKTEFPSDQLVKRERHD